MPIGVTYNDNKYRATISKHRKKYTLGLFDSPEEAFYKYKQEKEKHIKEVADNYRELIPKRLYRALYNYEVDIND